MNRRILVILGLFLITGAAAQDTPSPGDASSSTKQERPPVPADWPGVEYAEIRAYLYNPGENDANLILENGKLHPEVVNPEGVKLDAPQTERLLALLRNKAPDGSAVGCFTPHHGFVFYDREGNPVASFTACFLCELGVAVPGIHSMTTWDFAALGRLVQDLGLPVFKDPTEADAHFLELAKRWPDARVKAILDDYLFRETTQSPSDDFALLRLLQGLGERTHPFLLRYLADKDLRSGWLENDSAALFSGTRFDRLCAAFGDTPPAAAIPLLATFLEEADASIRCKAAETIAKTGSREIVPYLRKALADSGKDASSDGQVLPPPDDSGKVLELPGTTVYSSALAGLLAAMDRGTLHADAKEQLFPDVKALGRIFDDRDWARALIKMNPDRAKEFFLSPEMFKPDSPRLPAALTALCEMNLQLPRERLLGLCREVKSMSSGEEQTWIMGPALLLLGRQRHPDDLELLREFGNAPDALDARTGLLAWHGLEGYRDRLAKQEKEKGYAALNESQRLHFAAEEFEGASLDIGGYFVAAENERWRDALAGLKTMKRDELATILEQAVAKFGDAGPSSDREARQAQVDGLLQQNAFEELDERLGTAADLQHPSYDRFTIEHADSFK